MRRLQPDETDLLGKWTFLNGRMWADPTTERIEVLVDRHLQKIATDWSGWETLYRDPQDGRYWEHTYPQSEMHGGGPPRLTNISFDEAKAKYGDGIEIG
jgi:hypothetical protein